MTEGSDSWKRTLTGLQILASRPAGLGGAVIRMRAGPARDVVMDQIRSLFPKTTRITPTIDDTHLFGGMDLGATLKSGKIVNTSGLLNGPGVLCLSMAERCLPELAAKLGAYLDATPDAVLLAFDEGVDDDEKLPEKLAERLAFFMEPEGKCPGLQAMSQIPASDPEPLTDAQFELVTRTANSFGIVSLRAPLMAVKTAAALAALKGYAAAQENDIAQAAALVFAHRATRLPPEEIEEDDAPQQNPDPSEDDPASGSEQDLTLPDDLVVAAIKALLPPEVLAGLGRSGAGGAAQSGGQGHRKRGNRRGRPLPSRRGALSGQNRLDLLGTLRAAAPWQKVRQAQSPDRKGLLLRPADFRIRRYETKSDRLIVFAVDASGSAAVARLNETKGAIELLLGQAYAARDHVALISFRGEGAECLLPPTRSLVQTKRKLSALPGGGGTPLASGLHLAMATALQGRSKGMSPVIVLLTDGKSNIALDGTANRDQAREDAVHTAAGLRKTGLEVLVLDTGRRSGPQLRDLAQHLDATYMPLPRANAEKLSETVQTALDHA